MNFKKIKDSFDVFIADTLICGEYSVGNLNDQINLANRCCLSPEDCEGFFKNLNGIVPDGTKLTYTFANYAEPNAIYQAPIGNYVLSFSLKEA